MSNAARRTRKPIDETFVPPPFTGYASPAVEIIMSERRAQAARRLRMLETSRAQLATTERRREIDAYLAADDGDEEEWD